MRLSCDNKLDNDCGFSLVELIVAVAVGSIVAGAIASIIVVSVRMYSKESVNISEQYEIQTTLNQTVDSAESAQWFVMAEDKNISTGEVINTKYVAFGKLTGASGSMYFEGEIFTDDFDPDNPGKFNIYMNRYSGTALLVESEALARSKISAAATAIRGEKKYLLGEGATKYIVTLDTGSNRFTDESILLSDGSTAKGYYKNPMIFNISIDFEKKTMTGEIKKHVEDKVTFRNRIDKMLDIEGKGIYILKE